MTATADLLAFAAAPHDLPPDVREAALRLIADTLAVGAAGSSAPGADGVLAAARGWGADGAVPILGRGDTTFSGAGAAFVNGFQIHCLEWDAVHEGAVVHAMSVVVAAVHAVAHSRIGASKEEVFTAVVVGVEIACALGVAATSPLKFFRPATAGLIGAALAAARAAGLPADRFADVLGLAYGQCAGTMQAHVEGSIGLPLQIAAAARAAVTAVDLVANGLTGPHDALEGPFGYFALFEDGDLAPVAGTLGRRWRLLEISTKPWPCGRASHAALGVLEGLRAADVAAIDAHVPPLVLRLVGRPWTGDMTPAYARLCLPFLAAQMLVRGRIDPHHFGPAAFGDAELRAIGARVSLHDDGNPDANALSPQRFVVRMTNGDTIERTVAATSGSPADPLSPAAHADRLDFARSMARVPPSDKPPLRLLTGRL